MDAEKLSCRAYRFGRFVLDLNQGALLALGGVELPLRPKSFALLQLFVENAGRLLDRDTIMGAVWPDVFVTDDSITQCVGDIRRALGDEAQRMLRTVPRRGYLFPVEVSCTEPAMVVPVLPLAPLENQPRQVCLDNLPEDLVEHPPPNGAPGQTELIGLSAAEAFAEVDAPVWSDMERKFATVLVACIHDTTGGLSAPDPEELSKQADTLAALRPLIERFGGVMGVSLGNAAIVLFGAPRTLEDHAVQACRAALAMRSAVAGNSRGELGLRVCLDAGKVLVRNQVSGHETI